MVALVLVSLGWAAPEPTELPGRWYPNVYRAPAEASPELAQLEALGYLGGSEPDGPESGVLVWDQARAFSGTNLYSSGHAAEALLVGMDGRVRHRWAMPFHRAFPELNVTDPKATGAWRRVALRPEDGHLLAIYEGIGLVHLDERSQIVWATANRAHHDVRWLPNGGVLVLTRILHATGGPGGMPLLEDCVAELDRHGQEVRRVSVLKALARSPWASLLERAPLDTGDVLHTNAVFPMADGRMLLSMRHLDTLAILDLDEERITWAATGGWSRQHDVEIAPSGLVMLFDNRGAEDGTSRVLAMEPWSMRELWVYPKQGRRLVSEVLGAVQELPNGNVLITESTRGRVIEVTRAGETVWEYHNPKVTGPEDAFVAAIFEMIRLPADTAMPWLRE